MTKISFLKLGFFCFVLFNFFRVSSSEVVVISPDGRIKFELIVEDKVLKYRVLQDEKIIIRPSDFNISINKRIITRDVSVRISEPYRIFETYDWFGTHSKAINNGFGMLVKFKNGQSKVVYTLDIRAYNDGIAYRFTIPENLIPQVPDESGTFIIPEGSTVWYHGLINHYEDEYSVQKISNITKGTWAAPPVTMKLPGDGPFIALTESSLVNYPGMALQSNGKSGFTVKTGHTHPASYPFTLRYGDAEAKRLALPAAVKGEINTPWRVVVIAKDLNALVNTDIVQNLSPAPKLEYFPEGIKTAWIKPGRAVWRYLDGGGKNDIETMKEFCLLAGEMGFEYNIMEGFWREWNDEQVVELVNYARKQNVGLWGWQHSKEIRDSSAMENFFARCQRLGIVGVKIDFFDHEAKEVIELYEKFLESAARHQLMVNFHGANKPTGLNRTWPNEITREAVKGLEASKLENRALHDVILPFTRMVVGNGDYTPMHFGERKKNTSDAHQIASAIIFNSNLLTYAANPQNIKNHPALELIRTIPSFWDETIVLEPSEIGKIAIFARRKGKAWFVAGMNGPSAVKLKIPLSFLTEGSYNFISYSDETAGSTHRGQINADDSLSITLIPGGGFVYQLSQP